jgi:hypothetical protein
VSIPEVPYTDPASWRIAMEASAASLSMNTLKGPRLLDELPWFQGSFRLTRAGLPAGFTLRLPLPTRPEWLREEETAELLWESVSLEAAGIPNQFGGRTRLRLGRRETFASVSALCAKIPVGRSGRPYLKIVLETVFPSLSLRWPREARLRLRPVTLKLFSEIRLAETTPPS